MTQIEHCVASDVLLGEGSQASVFLGYDSEEQPKYAIKVYNSQVSKNFIESEIEVLKSNAKHSLQRSLKFVDSYVINDSYCVVTPLIQGIDLRQLLTEIHCFDETLAKQIFKQILLGLLELHKSGYAHLDLKPENIILQETMDITLVDFGFAEKIYSNSDKTSEVLLNKFCGSVHYTCPELVSHQPYKGTKADIWALGVLCFFLLAEVYPFDSASNDKYEIFRKIRNCEISWPSHFSSKLIHFIYCMLQTKPENRWEASRLLCHPWLSSI